MLEVNCIFCVDKKNGIAKNNEIPWVISEDLQYFNKITTQFDYIDSKNSVVMGKNTFLSIGKELNNRYNYVLSSENKENKENLLFHNNIQNIFQDINTKNTNKIFIIGGKTLYEHFINNNLIKFLYITKIDDNFNCDLSLELNLKNYKLVSDTEKICINKTNNKNYTLHFQKYENKNYINPKFWTYINNMPYCNFEEIQYLEIMDKIINTGHCRQTRNANTFSIFGSHMCFNLENNTLPLLTTKKMFTRG